MDFHLPGLIGELKDTGMYEVRMIPEEIPFEQGIAVYEIRSEFKFEVGTSLNNCSCLVVLESLQPQNFARYRQDQQVDTQINGNTLIEMNEDQQLSITKFGKDYKVFLKKNEMNRLGQFEIIVDTTDEFEQMKHEIFYMVYHITNRLSLTYNIPIKPTAFLFRFNILNIFTIIEAPSKKRVFENHIMNPIGNEQKWDAAVTHYRHSLLSNDPQSKFLWLYIACEILRSSIKEKIGLPEDAKKIVGKGFREPKIDEKLEYNNATPIFPDIMGKTYVSVLYGTFRDLRNAAAHHLLNDGTNKSVVNLNDYIEYYSAVPYLAKIFIGYASELYKLHQASE